MTEEMESGREERASGHGYEESDRRREHQSHDNRPDEMSRENERDAENGRGPRHPEGDDGKDRRHREHDGHEERRRSREDHGDRRDRRDRDRGRDKDREDRDRDRNRDRDRRDRDGDRHRDRDSERPRDKERGEKRRRSRSRDRSRSPRRSRRDEGHQRPRVSDYVALDQRPRRRDFWDYPPQGFEHMSALQVKSLDIFPIGPSAIGKSIATIPPPLMAAKKQLTPPEGAPPGLPPHMMGMGGMGHHMGMHQPPSAPPVDPAVAHAQRQAKRIYVGNIPYGCSDVDLIQHFTQLLHSVAPGLSPNPVASVQINADKNYAFIEFIGPDEATLCMSFDQTIFRGQPLKIRRPKDYQPPANEGLGQIADRRCRVTIRNIPPNIADEQIRELMESFGTIKNLQVPKLPNGDLEGSAICEYQDPAEAEICVAALAENALGLVVKQDVMPVIIPSLSGMTVAADVEISNILVLLGMVSEEELKDDEEYEDLYLDIKEECEKFGDIKSFFMPRPSEGEFVPGVGKVIIEYDSVASAKAAQFALAGRRFGQNIVITSYLTKEQFELGQF